MDDGTTQEALRVQYRHSQEVKLRTFEITLVTGEGGWYGTIQVEGNDDIRRSIGSISREAIDPPNVANIRPGTREFAQAT
jgi:hypothetical protein